MPTPEQLAGSIITAPDASPAPRQPCEAFIRRRLPCPSAASWRLVFSCHTCALDGVRLMCQEHRVNAAAGHIVCHACWKRAGQLVTLLIAAVEPL